MQWITKKTNGMGNLFFLEWDYDPQLVSLKDFTVLDCITVRTEHFKGDSNSQELVAGCR